MSNVPGGGAQRALVKVWQRLDDAALLVAECRSTGLGGHAYLEADAILTALCRFRDRVFAEMGPIEKWPKPK